MRDRTKGFGREVFGSLVVTESIIKLANALRPDRNESVGSSLTGPPRRPVFAIFDPTHERRTDSSTSTSSIAAVRQQTGYFVCTLNMIAYHKQVGQLLDRENNRIDRLLSDNGLRIAGTILSTKVFDSHVVVSWSCTPRVTNVMHRPRVRVAAAHGFDAAEMPFREGRWYDVIDVPRSMRSHHTLVTPTCFAVTAIALLRLGRKRVLATCVYVCVRCTERETEREIKQ